MHFGMLSQVGQGNQGTCITLRVDAPLGRGAFGVSSQFKSIVKHRILEGGVKGPILTICMSNDVYLCKELPFCRL